MKRFPGAAVLFLLMSTASAAGLAGTAPPSLAGARQPHDPITILSDEDLLLPDALSRNGVVGGTGRPDDPYVIRGWDIEYDVLEVALVIANVDAHVLIRDVRLFSSYGVPPPDSAQGGSALAIADSGNIRLEDVEIQHDAWGSRVEGKSAVTFRDVRFIETPLLVDGAGAQVLLENVEFHGAVASPDCRGCRATLRNVTIVGNGSYYGDHIGGNGLSLSPSEDGAEPRVVATNLTVRGMPRLAIAVLDGSLELSGCTLEAAADTISLYGGTTRIEGCVIHRGNTRGHTNGIVTLGGELMVFGLRLQGTGTGLAIHQSRAMIERSSFDDTAVAIAVRDLAGVSSDVTIRNTSFTRASSSAIKASGAPSIDARWNYWGSDAGPRLGESRGDQAGIEGDVAYVPYWTSPDFGAVGHERATPSPGVFAVVVACVLAAALVLRRRRDARGGVPEH